MIASEKPLRPRSVSPHTLDSKLHTYEEAHSHLRHECSFLHSQLNEKDELLCCAKETTMNAQALRKFVEVNRSFAGECAELLAQRNKLEMECSLYDHDREALMDFGNEAEDRARDAEARVNLLEGEVQRLSDELQLQKRDLDNQTGLKALNDEHELSLKDGELGEARDA